VELAAQQEGFRQQGLGVASLIPEPVETLREFTTRFGIDYPVLSDVGSVVIKRLGLVDPDFKTTDDSLKDIPLAGTFVVDERGVVRDKFFEKTNTDRRTGGSILVMNGAPGTNSTEIRTDHFKLLVSQSNLEVAPGQRIALALDFELEEKHHLYAAGDHSYRPLRLRVEPDPLLEIHEIRWPPPRPYFFAPLKETVPVFEGRFRALVDLTLRFDLPPGSPEREAHIAASLDHQVCSDKVCYPPGTLPLAWPLKLRPWVR
jgi:hypothetical protein